MPKFSIEVLRTTDETVWIDVEADDSGAAEAAAIAEAKCLDDAGWNCVNTEYAAVDQQIKGEMLAAMEKDLADSLAETIRSQ